MCCKYLYCGTVAMVPSLQGLAKSWDAVPELRTRIRDTGSIFQGVDTSIPAVVTKEAIHNKDVLLPALKCQRGHRKLFKIGQAEQQSLAWHADVKNICTHRCDAQVCFQC